MSAAECPSWHVLWSRFVALAAAYARETLSRASKSESAAARAAESALRAAGQDISRRFDEPLVLATPMLALTTEFIGYLAAYAASSATASDRLAALNTSGELLSAALFEYARRTSRATLSEEQAAAHVEPLVQALTTLALAYDEREYDESLRALNDALSFVCMRLAPLFATLSRAASDERLATRERLRRRDS